MAMGLLLMAVIGICPTSVSAQQWAGGSVPYWRHVNSCITLENGRMVAVGGNPVNDAIRSVFTSTTSGLSWDIDLDVLNGSWLWSVDFEGDQVGVAVGNDGAVVRTQSGGAAWQPQTSGTARHLRGVAFRDAATVFAVGGQTGPTPAQTIIRSNDGGVSWTTAVDGAGPMLTDVAFMDSQTGVAVGIAGTVLRTVNGGASWTPVSTPAPRDLNAVTFTGGTVGFAVGGRSINDSIRTIWTTADGGASWQVVMDTPGGWLRDIDFVDAAIGYAVGAESTVLMTADGGANWAQVPVPDPDVDISFNTVSAPAADFVLVAGTFGTLRIFHDIPAPGVETLSALVTSTTGATLRGELQSTAGGTHRFLFGTQPDLSDAGQTPAAAFNGSGSEQPMSFSLSGLTPDATYYYAARATTLGGMSTGEIFPLTVTLQPPQAVTGHAVVQSQSSVMLTGTVNTVGLQGQASFLFSSDPQLVDDVLSSTMTLTTEAAQDFQALIQMPPGGAMYYTLRVTTDAGTAYGDTLSLSADLPLVRIDSITGEDSGDVVFHGRVEGLQGNADVHFSYTQWPNAAVVVDAGPGSISGGGVHLLSGAVVPTLPMGMYHAKLHAVTDLHIYESLSVQFNVGELFTQFAVSDVHYDVLSETATFHGAVSGLAFPATLYFNYGNSADSWQVGAVPGAIADAGTYQLSATVPLAADNTVHWVSLAANSSSGWFQSEAVQFTTGLATSQLNVLTADSVTDVSALLRGLVGNYANEVSVHFELGATPALGTVVEASPGVIPAGTPAQVSAMVSGLAPDTYHYYCLALEVGNVVLRTDTRQFYTGEPPIPNWDFSGWGQRTGELPLGWKILEPGFERVSLGGGNSALRIHGHNAAILGTFTNPDGGQGMPNMRGTVALNHRPDNVHVVLDRHIEPGETAYLILRLDSADVTLHFDLHPITGSTGGAFEELVIPIAYDGPGTPDTVMVGFIPFDVMGAGEDVGAGINHLTIDRVHFGPGAPDVQHTALDDWFSYSFTEVHGWSYMKFIGITPEGGPQMVEPYTYANGTDTAIIIHGHLIPTFNEGGWIQTGSNSMVEHLRFFDVDRRHQVLTGHYMFLPQGMDTLEFGVDLMNGDDHVGRAMFRTADHTPQMTRFEAPVQYYAPTAPVPDRAYMSIRMVNASGAHPGSKAIVDKLCFDGFYIGPQAIDSLPVDVPAIPPMSMRVYPNPADGVVSVEWDAAVSPTLLRVSDMHGRIVEEFGLATNLGHVLLDAGKYAKGLYLVNLKNEDSSIAKRLIVIK